MSSGPQSNESIGPGGYHTQRLDDVSERLARLEGKMDSVATKEDVANAKVAMILAFVAMAITVLIGIVGIVVRFWPV